MLKINTTLFDLDVLYKTLSHGAISTMLDSLLYVKSEIKDCLDYLNYLSEQGDLKDDELEMHSHLTMQMFYINKNVRTLEDALLCHMTKTFEKRTIMGELTNICLN